MLHGFGHGAAQYRDLMRLFTKGAHIDYRVLWIHVDINSGRKVNVNAQAQQFRGQDLPNLSGKAVAVLGKGRAYRHIAAKGGGLLPW